MRRLGAGVVAAALLGVLGAAAGASEPDADKADKPVDRAPWRANKPLPAEKPKPKAEEKKPPPGPSPSDLMAKELSRHKNALLRRMQVCDRLRQVAQDTNDADLECKADELEEQARLAYQRHADRLGISAALAAEKKRDKSSAEPPKPVPAEREGEDKP
jgi:hypothetical protein